MLDNSKVLSLAGVKKRGLRYRYAQLRDVQYIASRLRNADRREIEASCPDLSPEAVLAMSYGMSGWTCWSVYPEGRYDQPICMVGLSCVDHETGAPWLLGTDGCDKHIRALLEISVVAVEQFHKLYPVLRNTIDSQNKMHVRWIKALGFTVWDGDDNERFKTFEKRIIQ